ncbi:Aste57867_9284 [Aphanomyces stellatus]|uniref:Aste57867_9284 protein n=1 Tax=Aphanomyces stellatus TaxID=120398 RepID=A0A485KMN1_9STRA|nr:hypothetical protein As57867_009248 [Aphanomyces stellatus]VFT86166.1 Aste57867_9284 [Aphanomyces stellatus]
MKFRFCGDMEPPAWLLAEIPCIASSVQHEVDLHVVTDAVIAAVLKASSYDEVRLVRRRWNRLMCARWMQVMNNLVVAVGELDAKAILVSIKWIVVHAAKYDIQESVLLPEVQQLGLPSDVARTIVSVYESHHTALRHHLQHHNTPFPAVMPCKWQVSLAVASRAAPALHTPMIELVLGHDFMELDVRTFRVLHQELKAARALMAAATQHVS